MNVLITGATGFVGQPLCQHLIKQNYTITATIRRPKDQQKLPQGTKCQLISGLNHILPTSILEHTNTIIHLAARAHQLNDQADDPEAEFQNVNHHGTVNLAQQAISAGVKHFIFISSIGAVTTLSDTIISEKTSCNPDTPYGRSKHDAEQSLIQLCQGSDMTWTILRPTLVYGPNNPGNMERLLALVNKSLPLPFASIHNVRSLLYVGNLVDAIITCIEHPKAKNQTFIVSDGQDLSTPKLIRQLGQALGKPAKLLPFPPSLLKLAAKSIGKAGIANRLLGSLQVDSSKIRNTLNWKPPYTIDEGLKITADWFTLRIR
ncbi:SDR family oxidoreductase [Synechocystis sp. LKSZ1]|uniref:UDP-glucose 4-epimerase family protein n=1 Tax=Synechocystis sp. LKSZ1 TaxID=3144951 RepID=UPI00336C13B4